MKTLKNSLENSRKFGMSFLLIFLFPALMSNLTVPKNDNPLSGAEKEGLVYTLEEARLAQNVNAYLHDKWQEATFEYVLNDETNNILKFQRFIKKQGGSDPLSYAVNGKFNIPSMQDEYNKYIKIGKNSLLSAYYVSMTLEEQNYLNMENRINESKNTDLIKMYTNRLSSIGDHMRVLDKHMKKMDVAYEAQYMSQEKFEGILNPDILLDDVSM
ncbi:DUF2202 domain-containing protein [Chondrinema litorale]|uniref:DUF2202 domain-containing protein n=1 Tax=Chondrinema litorale TaxID=2994555 RepID=UPI0025436556|nr:DUF2202 domain-containing protein [Chondrinema litorale]UZR94137.1 DUF2202 domain-containing protein [Chondrinema litorale]